MKQAFWAHYISDDTVKAICWTLIHSLWIGLVIALLSGIVIATTRKSAAILRYRLLCGLLLLFVISMAVTFNIELRLFKATQPPSPPIILVVTAGHLTVQQQVGAVLNKSFVDQAKEVLNQNINIIFIAWLLFFMLKSMKMISGLLYIQRIRRYKTHKVTEELKNRIEHLSSQTGIRRVVRLVQSELVKIPVAVGWLKPMILLPLGITLQLTPEQLDSILWHELAHIRRRDYLVNILQGLVETVFFFNPGLLWLSSLIRTEREACCDDMVLSRMHHKANYLEALLAFGYGEFKQAGLAMSLGSRTQLRERLKRMINQENKRLGLIEKVVLISGIVLLFIFAGLTKANKKYITKTPNSINAKISDNNDRQKVGHGVEIEVHKVKNVLPQGFSVGKKADSAISFVNINYSPGKPDGSIDYYVTSVDAQGNQYRFAVSKSRLVGLTINSKMVRKSELAKYVYMLKIVAPPPPPPPVQRAFPTTAQHEKIEEDTLSLVHVSMSSYRNVQDNIATDKLSAEDNHGKNYYFIINNEKITSMDVDGEKIKDSDLPKYQYMVKLVRENQAAAKARLNKKPGNVVVTDKPQKPQEPQPPQAPTPPPSLDKMIAEVTNDLVNEHIIKDKNSLVTLKLTYAELIVNGVKQPDDIQKKFAAKYYPGNARVSHDPNYGLWYNAKTHGVALGTFNIDLDAL